MSIRQEQIQFEIGFATDVGRKRSGEPNQDALEVVLPDSRGRWHPPLLIVADGLGKHMGGALASKLVVQAFKQEFVSAAHPADYLSLMERCAQKAHQAVRMQGAKDEKLANMGSTVVSATPFQGMLYVLNVGDSRAYILRGEKMIQVSQDQSWVAMQVKAGILTEQEARTHPSRNRLNMAITARRHEIKPHLAKEKLERDDIVVLCSDGLWGVIPETLIWAAASELPPKVAVKKLVSLANRSQGPDNISVIVARQVASDHKTASKPPGRGSAEF
ncbi:MAG: protein phosphatase 2C domain-containing protein [Anaerolineales bacterium]|nr:protein phosphatase 2C domain-containing protein [Anaerolineales bacterium]NUQ83449.1 serine/threonine-protein phosphatase [Anaerolineales bacterium]